MSATNILKNVKVEDIAPVTAKVITINSTDTVYTAYKKLASNNILSAPVYDTTREIFLGSFDYSDLVAYTMSILSETERLGENYYAMMESDERFLTTKIADIIDFSNRNPFCPVQAGSTVYDAAKFFVEQHVHRSPVVNADNCLMTVLTQTAIVNYIQNHVSELGPLANKTIKELDLGTHPVMCVSGDILAWEAFRIMHDMRISGLAMVDASERLVGNISTRDLKLEHGSVFSRLHMTVEDFVKKIRQQNINAVNPAISCSEDTTLEWVIRKLIGYRIHRIYVVNKEHKPVRVIAMRDIIKLVV